MTSECRGTGVDFSRRLALVRSRRGPRVGALKLWTEAAATYALRGCSPYYPPKLS